MSIPTKEFNFLKEEVKTINELIDDMNREPRNWLTYFSKTQIGYTGKVSTTSYNLSLVEQNYKMGGLVAKFVFNYPHYSYWGAAKGILYHDYFMWYKDISPMVDCYNRLLDAYEDHMQLSIEEFTESNIVHHRLDYLVTLYNRTYKDFSDHDVYIKNGKVVMPVQPVYTMDNLNWS